MDAVEALKTRRSVRRYLQEPVPRSLLREVAETGRYAPSAGNRQEWELILVDDPGTAGKVFDTLAWLPAVGPPPEGRKPTAYIVVISDEKTDGVADCASVTTYMLLAAHAMGLSGCWFSSISRTELSELLGIPDEYSIEFVLSLGYADEIMKAVDSDGHDKDVNVTDRATEVPKRRLPDMLHVNTFGNRD